MDKLLNKTGIHLSPGQDGGERRQDGSVKAAVLVQPGQRHELALVRGRGRGDGSAVRAGHRPDLGARHVQAQLLSAEQSEGVRDGVNALLLGRLAAHVHRLVRIVRGNGRRRFARSLLLARHLVPGAIPLSERQERWR